MRVALILLFLVLFWGARGLGAEPLGLDDCLALALRNHPSLQAVRARVRAAQSLARASFKELLPRVELELGYTRYRDRLKVVIMDHDVPLSSYEEVRGRLLVTFPVFHGLALRAKHRMSEIEAALAQVEEERVRQELVFRVKEAYFDLLKAEHLLAEARKSVERLGAHVEVARGFYEQGLVARNDLLQSEVALAEGEHALVRARNRVELARARLNLLLGRPVTAETEVVDTLEGRPGVPPFAACLEEALLRRPEAVAAGLNLEKARERVRLARSSFYPWLDLQGAYEKAGTDLAMSQNPYRDRENAWVALVLNWRLFEWGRGFDQVSGARAEALAEEARRREVRDRITLEVRQAHLRLTEARDRLRVAEKALEQAEENYLLNEARYEEQLASSTDVLDAEALLTRARTNYVNALADLHWARALLDYTLGRD